MVLNTDLKSSPGCNCTVAVCQSLASINLLEDVSKLSFIVHRKGFDMRISVC